MHFSFNHQKILFGQMSLGHKPILKLHILHILTQGCLQKVSRKFEGCFKKASRVFQGSFRGVSGKIQWCFKKVSRVFQVRLKGVQVISWGVQGNFKGVSGKFQWCEKCDLDVCCDFRLFN